jgi:amidase
MTAVAMAQAIRCGQLSARETVAAHLARIEKANPPVNAIVTLVPDQALAWAARADEMQARGEALGALHGLPIVHKDLQATRGIRTTWGSRIYQDFVPDADAPLVERVRAAGAITLGKSNTPEFGAGSQTFNAVFGATRNPFDLTKTCGGSTGGGAVALSCGMTALADGSDLGGSLRNPASFCGVVGLRPSPPALPAEWGPMAVEGPMARTVSDVAMFQAALAGECTGTLERAFKGVRVAWWKDLGGVPVDRRVREITNAQRAVFESLGCVVEEAEPDWTDVDATFKTLRWWSREVKNGAVLRENPGLVKDTILWELEQAARLTANDVGMALMKQTEIAQRMRRFLERYDFFVLPVSQVLPFDVTQEYPTEIDGVRMGTYIDWMKTCYYISTTDCPAVSVPCGFVDGLPVGIQIVGRHGRDFGLLQMAYGFEQGRAA